LPSTADAALAIAPHRSPTKINRRIVIPKN
jgi:hypothetical protein